MRRFMPIGVVAARARREPYGHASGPLAGEGRWSRVLNVSDETKYESSNWSGMRFLMHSYLARWFGKGTGYGSGTLAVA